METALEAMNKICQEVGICERPSIEAVGVKYARRMEKEGGIPVLAVLWEDGAITSVAFKDKTLVCAHTEKDGGNEAYFSWLAHLSAKGYKEKSIEVEGEPARQVIEKED